MYDTALMECRRKRIRPLTLYGLTDQTLNLFRSTTVWALVTDSEEGNFTLRDPVILRMRFVLDGLPARDDDSRAGAKVNTVVQVEVLFTPHTNTKVCLTILIDVNSPDKSLFSSAASFRFSTYNVCTCCVSPCHRRLTLNSHQA